MASSATPRIRSSRLLPHSGLAGIAAGMGCGLDTWRHVRSAASYASLGAEGGDAAWASRESQAGGWPRSRGDLRRMTIGVRSAGENVWEIPRRGGMRVPGRIFATAKQMEALTTDPCLQQVVNVAHLPGIVGYALGMPDIHWGYGFPIGGVAATRLEDGVISPGGVGYDINCGVRLVQTRLAFEEFGDRIPEVVGALAAATRLASAPMVRSHA